MENASGRARTRPTLTAHPRLWSRTRMLRGALSPAQAVVLGLVACGIALWWRWLVVNHGLLLGFRPTGVPAVASVPAIAGGPDIAGAPDLSDAAFGPHTAGDHDWPVEIAGALVMGPLAVAAFVDSVRHLLPDPLLLLGGGAATLTACLAGMGAPSPWASLAPFAIGFGAYCVGHVVSALSSLGRGDAKLLGGLGRWLGNVEALLAAVALATVAAGGFALVLMVARRATRTSAIALGPWLVGGAATAWIVLA